MLCFSGAITIAYYMMGPGTTLAGTTTVVQDVMVHIVCYKTIIPYHNVCNLSLWELRVLSDVNNTASARPQVLLGSY